MFSRCDTGDHEHRSSEPPIESRTWRHDEYIRGEWASSTDRGPSRRRVTASPWETHRVRPDFGRIGRMILDAGSDLWWRPSPFSWKGRDEIGEPRGPGGRLLGSSPPRDSSADGKPRRAIEPAWAFRSTVRDAPRDEPATHRAGGGLLLLRRRPPIAIQSARTWDPFPSRACRAETKSPSPARDRRGHRGRRRRSALIPPRERTDTNSLPHFSLSG